MNVIPQCMRKEIQHTNDTHKHTYTENPSQKILNTNCSWEESKEEREREEKMKKKRTTVLIFWKFNQKILK